MMGNSAVLGNKVERGVLDLLQKRLPAGWKARPKSVPAGKRPSFAPDLVLELSGPKGEKANIVVKAKALLEPKDVAAVSQQVLEYVKVVGGNAIPLVVSAFLSPSTRLRLKEEGVSYSDLSGNMRIFASRPAFYIEIQGAQRNPARQERRARSLKGAKAGRIVRALCDLPPPFEVRKLAQTVGINPGYVSRVLAFLDKEDLIQRQPRGPATVVRWRKLIERWAMDYSFMESNRVVSYLEPRDIDGLPKRLASVGGRVAVTGSAAAAAVAPVAPTKIVAAYVESPEQAAQKLGLRPAESGANVLLAEPYDAVVFDRVVKRAGVPCAALSQVAVDLLVSPGRGPSEGQALLDWMEANESTWRR